MGLLHQCRTHYEIMELLCYYAGARTCQGPVDGSSVEPGNFPTGGVLPFSKQIESPLVVDSCGYEVEESHLQCWYRKATSAVTLTIRRGCGDAVPFTPSQGIATPSPMSGLWYNQMPVFADGTSAGRPGVYYWGMVSQLTQQVSPQTATCGD